MEMGTYKEDIYTPYGSHESALRIASWLENEGSKYKILKQASHEIVLKRSLAMNPDIFFQLILTEDCVRAECWVKGITKDPITSKAVWAAISRRTGWNDFLQLKAKLSEGVIPGSL